MHVPGYQLDRLLKRTDAGSSGISVSIYVAFSERGEEEVVLKVVEGAPPGSPPLAVFERGARIWSSFRHRRIVRLVEDGCRSSQPFIASAYAPRGSLDRELARAGGRLLPSEALRAFVHVAEALEELGRRHIIHRSIQPTNILIGADGGYLLNDFLLAKEISLGEGHLTVVGRVKGGDERYMPPEQLRGIDVGPQADIYALGAVFYHLLVGNAPHEKIVEANKEWLSHLAGLLTEAPPPPLPDMRWHDYGDRIAEILSRALEPTVERRYQSATELMNDLRAIGEA
jgi:serine/threonine-protein kinase